MFLRPLALLLGGAAAGIGMWHVLMADDGSGLPAGRRPITTALAPPRPVARIALTDDGRHRRHACGVCRRRASRPRSRCSAASCSTTPRSTASSSSLAPDDFYREAHRKIFRAMLELTERNEPVDLVTLAEALRARGELQDVGGAAYLAELAERVPTAANVAHYARIVRDKAILRGLIATATEIAARGYEAPRDVEELLDEAEQQIFEISEREVQPAVRPHRRHRSSTTVQDRSSSSTSSKERSPACRRASPTSTS